MLWNGKTPTTLRSKRSVDQDVVSDSVPATVEVTMINGDNENPVCVYGNIRAINTLNKETTTLFNKDKTNYEEVKPLQPIPLLRSVVAVPLTSSIQVVADLWHYNSVLADKSIAQGTLIFAGAASGSNTDKIYGNYGVIEVKVTWLSR